MKRLLWILLILIFTAAFFVSQVQADEVNLKMSWAYSGTNTEGGFKVYLQPGGSTDFGMIADIADPAAREHTQLIDLEAGRNVFVMTAYDGVNESTHSNESPFEYMPIPALPAPQLIIQIVP